MGIEPGGFLVDVVVDERLPYTVRPAMQEVNRCSAEGEVAAIYPAGIVLKGRRRPSCPDGIRRLSRPHQSFSPSTDG